MPKRWERELHRLDEVDAPTERIRSKAERRPSPASPSDGLPPRRQRITAGVVAVVVFVAAGTFAWQAFRPSGHIADDIEPGPGTEVTVSLSSERSNGSSGPHASLEVAGTTTDGFTGTYSWRDGGRTIYADSVGPQFSPEEFLVVPLPANLVLEGDASDVHAWLDPYATFPPDEMRDLGDPKEQPIALDETGRFILLVEASWPQGDASFYFPIQLVPQQVNPATLVFQAKDEPTGHLQFGGLLQDGVRGEYQWCDGSDAACVAGIPEFATYPPVSEFMEIPAGTSLMLESAVPSIKGGFLTMDGEKASPTFEDPAHFGSIPTEPGKYALEVHVALDADEGAHGSATFWFGVEVVATQDGVVPSPALDAAPSTGEIRCLPDGSTVVTTPQVAARADGIHIELREASGATGVEVFKALSNGVHGTGWGPGQHPEVTLPVPIGRSRIACAWSDGGDPTSRDELAASQPIEFVDPGGFYHLDELPCSYDERTYPDDPAFGAYVEGNDHVALSEVIRRAVPGILPTDVVQYAGYPEADDAFRQWAVMREDQLVALVGDPRPLQGVWRFGPLETCGDAGIGTGDVTAGIVGSPFAVPEYSRCDPYATDCAVAVVEEHAYRLLGGEDSNPPSLGDFQGCYEDYVFPVDCGGQPGGTMWIALRLSPADKASFITRFGCGASPSDLCRESDVEPS